jgi:hypothetical protein
MSDCDVNLHAYVRNLGDSHSETNLQFGWKYEEPDFSDVRCILTHLPTKRMKRLAERISEIDERNTPTSTIERHKWRHATMD